MVEGAGAVGVAAIMHDKVDIENKKSLCNCKWWKY